MPLNANDLRDKPEVELRKQLAKLREAYFLRRFSSDPKRISNPGKFQHMKRDIARILTVLNEQSRQQAAKAAAATAPSQS